MFIFYFYIFDEKHHMN